MSKAVIFKKTNIYVLNPKKIIISIGIISFGFNKFSIVLNIWGVYANWGRREKKI